ncbi:aldehyde oxidAse and xanthine dehydrogenase, a/b hammerhead domain protein [delta proteobacterium NaphS2]|nr:aldehyde oxidAse and xanthine dehydrogenase, a/b hammerhead domain protein [delta proteobacterium NaphS2]
MNKEECSDNERSVIRVLSCMTLTVECDGADITTIEGMADRETGRLHPLQQAFIDNTAFQCGFCSRARALPGVRAVLTHEDIPPWEWGIPKHMRVLDNKVRYVGDAVAMVAADTADMAEAALEQIAVDYEYDVEASAENADPPLYEQYPNNTYPSGPPVYESKLLNGLHMGDVDQGFAEADVVAEGSCGYEIFPNPLPPEPPSVIATWETPDRLTIYTPSQSIAFNRFIGVPFIGMADLRAISTHCGGSYGTQNANMTPVGYAALLSKATGRPVKIYYTKEEHFHAYSLRLGSRIHARVGMKRDGTLTAVSGHWLVNTGSGSGPGQRNSLCKMAAEVLKLPLERVTMSSPDTHVNPFEFGLMGSRGTYAVGSAVIAAAEDARRRLLEMAAHRFEATPQIRYMGTLGGNLAQETRCWYYRYPDEMGGASCASARVKAPAWRLRGTTDIMLFSVISDASPSARLTRPLLRRPLTVKFKLPDPRAKGLWMSWISTAPWGTSCHPTRSSRKSGFPGLLLKTGRYSSSTGYGMPSISPL